MPPRPSDLATGTDLAASYGPALDRAHDLASAYLADLRSRPVSQQVTPAGMAARLDEPLPERGVAAEAAVAEWFARAEPGIVASTGPRYFGFVLGGAVPAAVAGDWVASVIDQNRGLWMASPAAAQTEVVVLRWLAELFGLPSAWTGTMTSGATMANMVGLAAGRQWAAARLGFDAAADGLAGHPPIAVVSSTEIHASARKALANLGLGRNAVRAVPAPTGAIDLAAFDATLSGIDGPVIVVANAGEVNGGAFDDLAAMADRCATHAPGAWLHVDGAFGLFARLDARTRHLLDGIERADSVGSDGHKWLNVPYDSGFAFVRDQSALTGAFGVGAAYLTRASTEAVALDERVPEMSQRFRALPVWCALKSLGREGYQQVVRRCNDNAAAFGAWVTGQPDLELVDPTVINIACFRVAPAGTSADEQDALTRETVARVQASGDAVVTGTARRGRAAIRAAFDNWLTTDADVAMLQAAVRTAVDGATA